MAESSPQRKSIFAWRSLRLCGSPRGVLALVETIQLGRAVTPQGESSFIRLPKRKFKGKFQICWLDFTENS